MKKIKITVMRKARHDDLIEKYENLIEHACDLQEGQVFICEGWQKPDGFCDSAWVAVVTSCKLCLIEHARILLCLVTQVYKKCWYKNAYFFTFPFRNFYAFSY